MEKERTINHKGITWKIGKGSITEVRLHAVTKSVQGKTTTIDRKLLKKYAIGGSK